MKLDQILEIRMSPWHSVLTGKSKIHLCKVSLYRHISRSWGRMTSNTKLDEKLEGADNSRVWKYRVMLILGEHDIEGFYEE